MSFCMTLVFIIRSANPNLHTQKNTIQLHNNHPQNRNSAYFIQWMLNKIETALKTETGVLTHAHPTVPDEEDVPIPSEMEPLLSDDMDDMDAGDTPLPTPATSEKPSVLDSSKAAVPPYEGS